MIASSGMEAMQNNYRIEMTIRQNNKRASLTHLHKCLPGHPHQTNNPRNQSKLDVSTISCRVNSQIMNIHRNLKNKPHHSEPNPSPKSALLSEIHHAVISNTSTQPPQATRMHSTLFHLIHAKPASARIPKLQAKCRKGYENRRGASSDYWGFIRWNNPGGRMGGGGMGWRDLIGLLG